MKIEKMELHKELFENEIRKYTDRPVGLCFVDDIADWAVLTNCGNAQGNPIAMAVITGGTEWGIVFRQTCTRQQINSVISGIEMRIGEKRITSLSLFLRHLALHELAHLINDWDHSFEAECDEWASERLF